MRTFSFICIVAVLAVSALASPKVFFCCEKGGESKKPFCRLISDSSVDWDNECDHTTIQNKVTGGSWDEYIEDVSPTSLNPRYTGVQQEFIGCPNNVDAAGVKVIKDEGGSTEVQVSSYNPPLAGETRSFANDSLRSAALVLTLLLGLSGGRNIS